MLLKNRGLVIDDWKSSRSILGEVGYYRLSAYFYPFRQIKPHRERTTPWNFRYDDFIEATRFQDAVDIYEFDRELRKILFEGLQLLEIELRSRISNCAGREDIYLHLKREHLDERMCSRRSSGGSKEAYDVWIRKYQSQIERASNEDFIQHHRHKYGGELPIWVALEILDFGSVVRLYDFLPKRIKNEIAQLFGVSQGAIFSSWLRTFNYLRNVIAHHSRLWNRVLVITPQKLNPKVVGTELEHLAGEETRKLYPATAMLAYSLKGKEQVNDWRNQLRDHLINFPAVPTVDQRQSMGLPHKWDELELWTT